MLEAKFLVKLIRMSSECLRFTTIMMQNLFSKAGEKRLLYFGLFLVLIVVAYHIQFHFHHSMFQRKEESEWSSPGDRMQ